MRVIRLARVLLLASALAGCAGGYGAARPLAAAGEIPSADYEVRTLVALAPSKQGDGEMIAAVLYLLPARTPLEVWEGSYPTGGGGWLLQSSLGNGSGNEHLRLVQSAAHYDALVLPGGDGRALGYALVHKAVKASMRQASGKAFLILGASEFIDPHYIGPGSGR